MALRIIFPQSVTVTPEQANTFNIQWEIDESGQTAYELQYKLKKDKVWSTCGKVYDPDARECNFGDIYNACSVQFYEIMYRIAVYLEGPNVIIDDEGETREGISHSIITSEAYWVIFKDFIEDYTLKVYDPQYPLPLEYPLYNGISEESYELAEIESLHVNAGYEDFPVKKTLALVQLDSPLAGDLRIQTPTGIKAAVEQSHIDFRPTKLYSYGYIDQYVFKYYAEYIDQYDKYYGYMPIYQYQTVYAYDFIYYTKPHYIDQYDYMIYYALDIYNYEYSYYYPNYTSYTYSYSYYYTYYTNEYGTTYEAYTDYRYSYSTYYPKYKKVTGPSQYTVDVPASYGYKWDKNGRPYSYVASYTRVRPTITYYEADGYGTVNHYEAFTAYREKGYYYSQSHGATGYAYTTYYYVSGYTFVPSAYAYDYYTIYSYDYDSYSMYALYTYYIVDYYTSYNTGLYYRYNDYYYDYLDRYIQYYRGIYQYYIVYNYVDVSYSYTYTIP